MINFMHAPLITLGLSRNLSCRFMPLKAVFSNRKQSPSHRRFILKQFYLLFFLPIFFLSLYLVSPASAGLKTANITQVASNSFTVTVTAPTINAGSGVEEILLVVNKDDNPHWLPVDGVFYSDPQAAAQQVGSDHLVVSVSAGNGETHSLTVTGLEMGSRYLFKPWFKYHDNGVIKYTSPGNRFASDELYRHQEVINTIAGELAKLTADLQEKKSLPESSFTQTLLNTVVDDAKQKLKEGVEEGIKNFIMDRVLKQAGLGALDSFSAANKAHISQYYNAAKDAYDQGAEYVATVQTISNGLQADNPALNLSRAAVSTVAPYAEPLFYATEVAVDAYVTTAGVKAAIDVFSEAVSRMQDHLDVETQNMVATVKAETYFGFCVTDLGGVLEHDLLLRVKDMPYVVSTDLFLAATPAASDADGRVTLRVPYDATNGGRILILLNDGKNITVQAGAEFDVNWAIFDKAGAENWGAIIYQPGALGKMAPVDIYNGGKNQEAALIIRSSAYNDAGFDFYGAVYGSAAAGVLIDGGRITIDTSIKAIGNAGPGLWLKEPAAGSLIRRAILDNNYQGILFQGQAAIDNVDFGQHTISDRRNIEIIRNQHPEMPVSSEDLVFMDMDYSSALGDLIGRIIRPESGLFFVGKQDMTSTPPTRKFTIPAGSRFIVPSGRFATLRFTDHLLIKGSLDLQSGLVVMAGSQHVPGLIEVASGGELNGEDIVFSQLQAASSWDGVWYREHSHGILKQVTISGGGYGAMKAQLTLQSLVSVSNCLFTGSNGYGVVVDAPAPRAPEFSGNRITGAKAHGLYVLQAAHFAPRNNIFEKSNGDGRAFFAVYASASGFGKLDASANFWDDNSGPTSPDNPGGIGATAGAMVDFDPWIGKNGGGTPAADTQGAAFAQSPAALDLLQGGYAFSRTTSRRPTTSTGIYLSIGHPLALTVDDLARYQNPFIGNDSLGQRIYWQRLQTYIKPGTFELGMRVLDSGSYIQRYIRDVETNTSVTLNRAGSPYFAGSIGVAGTLTVPPGVVVLAPLLVIQPGGLVNGSGAAFVSLPDELFNSTSALFSYIDNLRSAQGLKQGGAIQFILQGGRLVLDNCLLIQDSGGYITGANQAPGDCASSSLSITHSHLYNMPFLPSWAGNITLTDNVFMAARKSGLNYASLKPYVGLETCDLDFSNNVVDFSKCNERRCRIILSGGTGKVTVKNNRIFGGDGLELDLRQADLTAVSQPVTVAGNNLSRSYQGIIIKSTLETTPFNINRLKISNNTVRTAIDPGYFGRQCGTGCVMPEPGLALTDFAAAGPAGFTAAANDFRAVAFGGRMIDGNFTLTPDLLEGLAGPERIMLLSDHLGFDILPKAAFTIAGTEAKPITVLGFTNTMNIVDVYGTFNASHTVFSDIFDPALAVNQGRGEYESYWLTGTYDPANFNNIATYNGIRFRSGSRGRLDGVSVRRARTLPGNGSHGNTFYGVGILSPDVIVTNSSFIDNFIGVELYNTAATVTNNTFQRNIHGVFLAKQNVINGYFPPETPFTASPTLTGNSFAGNHYGYLIENPTQAISLANNIFLGDSSSTGINIYNYNHAATTQTVDARNIFWGRDSGPQTGTNSGGQGVKIDDTAGVVRYDSWISNTESHIVTPSVAGSGGIISPSGPQSLTYGETAQFSLAAEPNYHPAGVVGTCRGLFNDTANTFTTEAVISDCTVVAHFEIDRQHLTVSTRGRGKVSGGGLDCPRVSCTGEADYGTELLLTATSSSGYVFDSWNNCDNALDNYCTMSMNADKSCMAVFKIGDTNNDGHLDLADLISLLEVMTNQSSDTQGISGFMDEDGDGRAGFTEAFHVLRQLAGF